MGQSSTIGLCSIALYQITKLPEGAFSQLFFDDPKSVFFCDVFCTKRNSECSTIQQKHWELQMIWQVTSPQPLRMNHGLLENPSFTGASATHFQFIRDFPMKIPQNHHSSLGKHPFLEDFPIEFSRTSPFFIGFHMISWVKCDQRGDDSSFTISDDQVPLRRPRRAVANLPAAPYAFSWASQTQQMDGAASFPGHVLGSVLLVDLQRFR